MKTIESSKKETNYQEIADYIQDLLYNGIIFAIIVLTIEAIIALSNGKEYINLY